LRFISKTQLTLGILFSFFLCAPAFAQYTGGTAAPTYGSGKVIALGAGAAAAGAGVLYLTLRHRGSLTGCVENSDDGFSLVDEKKHQTYYLLPGRTNLQSGELFVLRGKRSKDGNGAATFEVDKAVKLGSCKTQ
jgi:hypothetical protein